MPSDVEMKALLKRYVSLINERDITALMLLFDVDAVVEDPVGGATMRGLRDIEMFYQTAMDIGVRLEIEGEPRGSFAAAAAMSFRVFVSDGAVLNVIDVFHFNEAGKIATMKAHYGPSDVTPAPVAT